MLHSMTAYGRACGEGGGKRFTVEIKSVNNRFFDCTVRTPRAFGFLEERIKTRLGERGISRGKIEVGVSVTVIDTPEVSVVVDEGLAKGYIGALEQLRRGFPSLRDDISVTNVARMGDVLIIAKPDEDADADYAALLPTLDGAIDAFLAARAREGENLRRDLCAKGENLRRMAEEIAAKADGQTEAYRARLQEKLRDTLAAIGADPAVYEARMMTECAIFADRVAVDEETVRLRSHLEAYFEALDSDEPVGRRLDFLLQEMNREVNTTGSKVDDLSLTNIVVDMKCELEKIREQIQNLE